MSCISFEAVLLLIPLRLGSCVIVIFESFHLRYRAKISKNLFFFCSCPCMCACSGACVWAVVCTWVSFARECEINVHVILFLVPGKDVRTKRGKKGDWQELSERERKSASVRLCGGAEREVRKCACVWAWWTQIWEKERERKKDKLSCSLKVS